MKIGTIDVKPNSIQYGTFTGVALPTGSTDDIPLVVAQGQADGPCLWITGSIHGDEYSGLSTIMTLLGNNGEDFPLDELRGTVVFVPTLSPAGLRTGKRAPYYNFGSDPNRMFPDMRPNSDDDGEDTSTMLERTFARLYQTITDTADYLVDLHNAGIGSIPFVFFDPIYYAQGEREEAEALQQQTRDLLQAFGMPVVNEFPSKTYLDKKLHRSVSGAVLNKARIPAITVELGGYDFVDVVARDAAVIGCRNVMRWAGMLTSDVEAMPEIPQPAVDFPVRRKSHPRVPQSGVVNFMVEAGDLVSEGQVVARLTDIWGRGLGDNEGLIISEHDGYVIGLLTGNIYYENEPIISMAIRDDSEMLIELDDDEG